MTLVKWVFGPTQHGPPDLFKAASPLLKQLAGAMVVLILGRVEAELKSTKH